MTAQPWAALALLMLEQRMLKLVARGDPKFGEDVPEVIGDGVLATVAYHLHNTFSKLNVASRHQLAQALPDGAQQA